jgi:hypothetical protein
MDQTPWIGRQRPVEHDALRLLAVVHHLGEPAAESGYRSRVAGEGRLQRLDHLVRHPADLAFVVLDRIDRHDGVARRRDELVPALRRLLPEMERGAAEGVEEELAGEPLHRFHPVAWERRDDVLAYLGCRDLLRIRPLPDAAGELGYLLPEGAAEWLDTEVYPPAADPAEGLGRLVERCRLLARVLGGASDPAGSPDPEVADLAGYLRQVDRRLEDFRREERVPFEEDLLSRFFRYVVGEAP